MPDQKSTKTILAEITKKANAYDACVKENVALTKKYNEYKKELCSISKEYFSMTKSILGKKINEMDLSEKNKIIAPEHQITIEKHCKISISNKELSAEQEKEYDSNGVAGEIKSNGEVHSPDL